MALTLQITNVGRAALVNAANTGTLPVTIAEIGVSATHGAVTAATTALAGEIKRLATSGGEVVADDTIHTTIRDESTDVYSLKAFGLYLTDGTLFGVYSQAATILEKSAGALLLLAADVRLSDIAASSLTFGSTEFLNPPATETVKGVAYLATDAEAAAHTNANKIVTPKSLWFAFGAWFTAVTGDIWRASNDGSGSGLDADLLDGLHATAFVRFAGFNPASGGSVIVAGDTATHEWSAAPIHIREVNYVGAAQSGAEYAPALTFHWGSVIASAIKMHADGHFRFRAAGTDPTAFRNVYAAAFIAGTNPCWHAGNDGSGSGLDADTLDGLNSSTFVRRDGVSNGAQNFSVVLAGATPSNGISSTPLVLREVNYNGAGSNSLTYAPGLTFLWDGYYAGSLKMGHDGQFRFRSDSADPNAFCNVLAANFYASNNLVWHAGNDGAGSGLDADTLDGKQGSDFCQNDGLPNISRSGGVILAGSTATHDWGGAPIYLREVGYVANTQTDASYAPALSFVWSGVAGSSIKMTADGAFRFRSDGTNPNVYRAVYAASFIAGTNPCWHAGNDGSGSGLDADTLDGKQGSEYALLTGASFTGQINVAQRVTVGDNGGEGGEIHLLAGSDSTISGNVLLDVTSNRVRIFETAGSARGVYIDLSLAAAGVNSRLAMLSEVWHAGNDGSGSGLDADTVDGLQASVFTRRDGTDNTALDGGIKVAGSGASHDWGAAPIHVREVGYVGNTQSDAAYCPRISFHWAAIVASSINMTSDGAFRFRAAGTDPTAYRAVYAASFIAGTNPCWHTGNDGSGSGLDADTVDGKHASDFLLANAFSDLNLSGTGHYQLPGGLLVNWFTTGALGNDGTATSGLSKNFTVLLGAVATAHMNNPVNDNWATMVNPPIGGACSALTVSRGYPGGPGESGAVTCIAWGIA